MYYSKFTMNQHNYSSLTGAPVKPIKGTFPSSIFRIMVMASPTYVSRCTAPSRVSLDISSGVFKGSGKTGP